MVIPNGFDTTRFSADPAAREAARALFGFADGVFRVACIARMHPMKDHARLVEAVAGARMRGCDIHLVLVGHGLEEPPVELRQLIENQLPADRVTTCGARFDVADWLPGIDLLAVPSAWGEAFPNVIGEALACEVPVVATDVGDSARIVGEQGLIVPPKDTRALTEAILASAARTAAEREAMGRAGRMRVVADYALARIGSRYSDMHAACLDQMQRGDSRRKPLHRPVVVRNNRIGRQDLVRPGAEKIDPACPVDRIVFRNNPVEILRPEESQLGDLARRPRAKEAAHEIVDRPHQLTPRSG